jgi:hypothetical protein
MAIHLHWAAIPVRRVIKAPMFRYKLRTLLIALAVMPPLLAVAWFCGWIAQQGISQTVFSQPHLR